MKLPAEFVVYRRLSQYSRLTKLVSLGCPFRILADVSCVCEFWANCFQDYSGPEVSSQGVSVERFLNGADFAVFQTHHVKGETMVATDTELWYWIMCVARGITPLEFFLLMDKKLKTPNSCVLIPTWTGRYT